MPPPTLAIGSLGPVLDDMGPTEIPAGYTLREDTVYVGCELKPSGFPRQNFAGTTCIAWTASQRAKATGVHYLETSKDLSKHVIRCFYPLYSASPLLHVFSS